MSPLFWWHYVDELIEELAKLVTWLADGADAFTKIRLLKVAERYQHELGRPSKAVPRCRSIFLE